MRNSNILKRQQGDTIVEVLIAIAVVSSVMGIAYSAMNRNLLVMRDNQERSEASKLAQGQVEALKSFWITAPDATARNELLRSTPFCMSGGVPENTGSGTVTADFTTDVFPYEVACRSDYYNIGIRYNSGTHTITVRWGQAGRSGRNEVAIAYRLE